MVFDGADGSQSDQLERFSWQSLQNNYEIHYQYDANGNITQITDGKGKIQYTYDTRNQLIREEREADRQTITYAYDKNGNLLQKNRYEYQPEVAMETLASATPSETKIYRYEGNWKDQLTSYNGETIAYDAMGNPTVYRGMEMGWKNSSELTEIVKDQTTIRYRYDKEGMRNRKYLSDGTTVLYQVQDGQIIGEQHLREDQEKPLYEMTFSYDADGTLFSMNCDGKDYYYILNPTGDVTALVDTGWNTVVSYAYDSWGKVTAIEGDQDLGKKNPLRYRGYYWDEETGLYYLASRYYDPEVGRLINADDINVPGMNLTVSSNKNLYAYCDNNPITRTDLSGEFWHLAIGAVVGAASQYAANVVLKLGEGNSLKEALLVKKEEIPGLMGAAFSGLLTATGISAGGLTVANAAINTVTYLAECEVTGTKVNKKTLAINVAIGAVGDIKGDGGINGKKLSGIWKESNRQLKRLKSAKKIMRYTAKKTTVRKTVVKKVGETFWSSFKTNIGYPKFGKWIKKKWKTVKKIWKKYR